MDLLIFGQTGQVARELARVVPDAHFLSRQDADLTDPSALAARIRTLRPDAVVNAAAWTGVDAAEDHEDQALAVNAAGPGAMALACTELSIPLVHLSTDYVFDGNGSAPFPPDHPTAPLGGLWQNQVGRRKGCARRRRGACYFADKLGFLGPWGQLCQIDAAAV